MTWRRIVSFLCVCLAAFGIALPGISQEKTKVVLWHAYRGAERKALEATIAEFNTQSKTTVLESLAVPFDALPDKISAAVPQGKGPDLWIFAHDRIGNWAESGVVEGINFYAQKDKTVLERFFPATLEPLIYRSALYGLPMAFKSTALYYNKNLVKVIPQTTEDFIALAKSMTNKATGTYGLVYENSNFYYHAAWLHGFGGAVFDAQGKLVLNSPATIASLEFARDLKQKHGIVPDEITNTLVTSLFNEGKAAFAISGPWFAGELKAGLNYGVVPLPRIAATGQPAKPYLGSEALLMSAKSTKKEAAYEAMVFLTGVGPAKTRLSQGRQTVATKAAYDGVTDPFINAFKQQLANTVPMSNSPQMLSVWTPVTTMMSKVISGRAQPADAAREAQAACEQAFKSVKR